MSEIKKAAPVAVEEFSSPPPIADPSLDVVTNFIEATKDAVRFNEGHRSDPGGFGFYCNQAGDPRVDFRWGAADHDRPTRNADRGFVNALVNEKGDLDPKNGRKVMRHGMTLLFRSRDVKERRDQIYTQEVMARTKSASSEVQNSAQAMGFPENSVTRQETEREISKQ